MSAAGVKMHGLKYTLKKSWFWMLMGFICFFIGSAANILGYKRLGLASFYVFILCFFSCTTCLQSMSSKEIGRHIDFLEKD